MAITVAQWIKASSASTASFTANTTTGNTLVACITYASTTVTVATCKTTANTFTQAVIIPAGNSTGGSSELWYFQNCTGETTPTVTLTWSGTAPSPITIDLFELHSSTAGNLVYYDKSSSAANRATAVTVTSFTPTNANSIVIAGARCSATMSAAALTNNDLVSPAVRSEYVIQTTATAFTAVGTDSASNTWNEAVAAAFYDAPPKILPAGIASTTAFGTAVRGSSASIAPSGISSATAFGTLNIRIVVAGVAAFVQGNSAYTGYADNAVVSLPGSTVDNVLVVALYCSDPYVVTGITDSNGNAYSPLQSWLSVLFNDIFLWTAPITTGGPVTITVQLDHGTYNGCSVAEYSGIVVPVVLDVSSTNNTATGTVPGTVTTTNAADIVLSYIISGGAGTPAVASPFTVRVQPPTDNSAFADNIVTTTGTYTATWTVSNAGSVHMAAVQAATAPTGAVNITPSGIGSVTAFGAISVSASSVIAPAGIASTNLFGTVTVVAASTVDVVLLCHLDSGFTDVSNYAHTLTPVGLTAISATNKNFGAGSAYYNIGNAGSAISTNNSADFHFGAAPFTIEAWCYAIASGSGDGYNPILAEWDTVLGNVSFFFNVFPHLMFFWSPDGNAYDYVDSTSTLPLNTWTHVAVDRDASNVIRIYQNGVIVGAKAMSGSLFASTYICQIGNDASAGRAFPGYLDEVRVVRGTAMYGGAFTPPTAPFLPPDPTGTTQNIVPAGIASTTVFGTAAIGRGAVNLAPSGISSVTAFGAATVATTFSVTPVGIASVTALGTAIVSATFSVTPTGIASVTAFGTAALTPGAVGITPSGIASVTAFGAATVSRGAVNIAPSGIASTNAFGTVLVVAVVAGNISPAGIASVTAFGAPAVLTGAVNITPTGIVSTATFGAASITSAANIAPTGIASKTAFGAPAIAVGATNVAPSGIASVTAFGTTTIVVAPVANIAPLGIASTTVFGTPTLRVIGGVYQIFPAGIPSTTTFGLPIVAIGEITSPVYRYTGYPQDPEIYSPAWIEYREDEQEEGPWAMPPYEWIFPHPAPAPIEERGTDAFHREWLKTHKRPPGPRRLGDANHRPQSVLPPFTRPKLIKPKKVK